MGLREDAAILGYGLSECGPIVGGATPLNLMDASDEDAFVRLDRPTAGHAVRIVDDSGRPVLEGIIGNVEVTGATLASGYYGDEAATARMFTTDGWLRTGDLGRLDDGTLTIVGQVKEVISINARKYACAEIEAIAEQIPVVREAYAVPLGDGVATGGKQSPFALFVVAPFVPASGFPALADRIRRSVAAVIGLAPRSIHAIREDDVPRTTTGKVRRLELADLATGGPEAAEPTAPLVGAPAAASEAFDETEAKVAAIMARLLNQTAIGRDEDFYSLGGNSVAALQLVFELEGQFGISLPTTIVHQETTVARLAALLNPATRSDYHDPRGGTWRIGHHRIVTTDASDDRLPETIEHQIRERISNWAGDRPSPYPLLRGLNAAGSRQPLFWCLQGEREFLRLAQLIGDEQPVYAMRSGVLVMRYSTGNLDALAERYADEIQAIDPTGPYWIGGNCQGGVIAIGIAKKLFQRGYHVALLSLLDTVVADRFPTAPYPGRVSLFYGTLSRLNPLRIFRTPELGWRKLSPEGLIVRYVPVDHGEFFVEGGHLLIDLLREASPGHRSFGPNPTGLLSEPFPTPPTARAFSFLRRRECLSRAKKRKSGRMCGTARWWFGDAPNRVASFSATTGSVPMASCSAGPMAARHSTTMCRRTARSICCLPSGHRRSPAITSLSSIWSRRA